MSPLAGDAVRALGEGSFGGLFATGGETINAILDCLRVTQFDLLGEIAPGVPIGQVRIAGRKLLLGMKAGGFGDVDTLRRAADRLTSHMKELDA
jgi:uncharacterized protein YgbK (DUF1537 family)